MSDAIAVAASISRGIIPKARGRPVTIVACGVAAGVAFVGSRRGPRSLPGCANSAGGIASAPSTAPKKRRRLMGLTKDLLVDAASALKAAVSSVEERIHGGSRRRLLPGFPKAVQIDGYSCGVQSTRMVLEYFGHKYRATAVKRMIRTTRGGTSDENIISVLREHGLRCSAFAGQSRTRLVRAIRANAPVIVALDDERHFGVVYGYGRDAIYLADPSLRRICVRWCWSDFRERWSGNGIAIRRPPRRR